MSFDRVKTRGFSGGILCDVGNHTLQSTQSRQNNVEGLAPPLFRAPVLARRRTRATRRAGSRSRRSAGRCAATLQAGSRSRRSADRCAAAQDRRDLRRELGGVLERFHGQGRRSRQTCGAQVGDIFRRPIELGTRTHRQGPPAPAHRFVLGRPRPSSLERTASLCAKACDHKLQHVHIGPPGRSELLRNPIAFEAEIDGSARTKARQGLPVSPAPCF